MGKQSNGRVSVTIPSRNRVFLLDNAIASVASQINAEFEIIVVNDGTEGAEGIKLDELKLNYAGKARFIDLPVTNGGNGCFRVMNTGALHASGNYLCFLDDDDE